MKKFMKAMDDRDDIIKNYNEIWLQTLCYENIEVKKI